MPTNRRTAEMWTEDSNGRLIKTSIKGVAIITFTDNKWKWKTLPLNGIKNKKIFGESNSDKDAKRKASSILNKY